MTYEYSNYLAHHGVKGMRWGHRKDIDKKTSDDVLTEWAIYANSPTRTADENTTPLVIKYQKEIERIRKSKSMKISTVQAARIANKTRDWIGEISGAMLRDMGYEDSEKSRERMKSYPWMKDLWTPIYA